MNLLRTLLFIFLFAFGLPGWCAEGQSPGNSEDAASAKTLSAGSQLLKAGKPGEAIGYFEQVATGYEDRFKNDKAKFFCARSQPESLLYLLEAANAKKGDAKVVSVNWAYAYYLKAYALLELGRVAEAKSSLERALTLSPRNSQFLAELGNIHQREKNWPVALETFQRAEAAAKEFSPPNLKNAELSRAWRGIGYVYVEQNKLDEAEKMYQRCLELDKGDTKAANELRYIQNLRTKRASR